MLLGRSLGLQGRLAALTTVVQGLHSEQDTIRESTPTSRILNLLCSRG